MGDKVHTLVIKVDLSCCRCRKGIQDYLCRIQCREHILQITYEDKNNTVLVSGPFNPEALKRKLLCKLCKIIKNIDIKEPPKPDPKPPEEKKKPLPRDECKDKFMKNCEEEYEEIKKSIEKCKKECEEKCKKQCEDKFKRKCKCACECKCEKKEEPLKEPQNKESPKKLPERSSPPTVACPLITTVCCASPCPCFVAWCNNYRCCSCGVVGWPGWCGPGWGTGPSFGGRPCFGNQPQWGCEPNKPPNIVVESTSPSCSIM